MTEAALTIGDDLVARNVGLSIVTLGTAAGPAIRSAELGIATAIIVDNVWYLVDFGLGCTRSARDCGLKGSALGAAFITHMHSDHVAEVPPFLLWNWGPAVEGISTRPVTLMGPGDAEAGGKTFAGTRRMTQHILDAFGYDVAIRELDEARPALRELIQARDLSPRMDSPTPIYQDDRVSVTAVLVDHPPVVPSYAFRFDTRYGSVTMSGDTAESEALAELAQGTDILVHEAVNLDFYRGRGFSEEFVRHQEISHTPPDGAGRVASQARAGSLVLSHLAGPAPIDYWREKAGGEYDGPIHVARSGDHYRLPAVGAPLKVASRT